MHDKKRKKNKVNVPFRSMRERCNASLVASLCVYYKETKIRSMAINDTARFALEISFIFR